MTSFPYAPSRGAPTAAGASVSTVSKATSITVYVRKLDEKRRTVSISPLPDGDWRKWLEAGYAIDGNTGTKIVAIDELLGEERKLAEEYDMEFR